MHLLDSLTNANRYVPLELTLQVLSCGEVIRVCMGFTECMEGDEWLNGYGGMRRTCHSPRPASPCPAAHPLPQNNRTAEQQNSPGTCHANQNFSKLLGTLKQALPSHDPYLWYNARRRCATVQVVPPPLPPLPSHSVGLAFDIGRPSSPEGPSFLTLKSFCAHRSRTNAINTPRITPYSRLILAHEPPSGPSHLVLVCSAAQPALWPPQSLHLPRTYPPLRYSPTRLRERSRGREGTLPGHGIAWPPVIHPATVCASVPPN